MGRVTAIITKKSLASYEASKNAQLGVGHELR